MLRIVRIALFAFVPSLALGLMLAACSDDTTNMTTQDMPAVVRDMSLPVVRDLATPID